MMRVVLASFVGAVVFFFWGFIYWSLLPTGPMIFEPTGEEQVLAEQLKKSIPQSGTYTIPGIHLASSDMDEFVRRHEAGPVATIFIRPGGGPVMPPSTFLFGFLSMWASVLFMALVLRLAGPALDGFPHRAGLVVLAGLIAIPVSDFGPPIWFHFPWALWIGNAVFHLTAWILVGLVLAQMMKPAKPSVEPA